MKEAVKARRVRRSESQWRTLLKGSREDGVRVRQDSGSAFVDLGALEPVAAVKPTLDLRLELGDGLTLHLVRH